MRQLTYHNGEKSDSPFTFADGAPLTPADVRAAADFGVFIDFASLCQKQDHNGEHDSESGQRSDVELGLFKHALDNLDVMYAHKGTSSLLSTRIPDGVSISRAYGDRGWCCFERAEGELAKPDHFQVDIGLFNAEDACRPDLVSPLHGTMGDSEHHLLQIGLKPFVQLTVCLLYTSPSPRDS